MADKPNIILIYPDQQRGDAIGCVNPAVRTPNLDRLAAEGVTFTRCATNSPLCMPARASLITGQYVNEHGVWNNSIEANRHGPSHVRNIRDAGYHTMLIGKAHLYMGGGHTSKHVQKLRDWGYEDSHELPGPFGSARIDSPYSDYLAKKGLLEAQRNYFVEFRRLVASGELHSWQDLVWPLSTDDHIDSYTGRQATEWIRNYHGDKPFYLHVGFPGPHNPFDSPAEYRALYKPEETPAGIMDPPGEPIAPQVELMLRRSQLDGITERDRQEMRTFYYGKITLIDDWIGEIVKALEGKGFLNNTWIIYTSDHGEMLGDFYLKGKRVFYEGAARVPCVIRPPGGTKGWQSAGLTEQLDITASLLDIAGAEPLEKSDGRSLVPKVKAGPDDVGAQKGKEAVFSEVTGYSMVRTERYKMSVDSRTRQPVDLYDMLDDPNELRNLVNDPSLEKVRNKLLKEHLSRLLSHLDDDKLKVFEEKGW